MKLIFLPMLAVLLFSCGKSKPSRTVIDDSGMTEIVLSNDSTVYVQDCVRDVEVIPLESSGRVMVGRVDGVIVTDENIIVYDIRQAHCVFIFGRDGKYQATINRRGRGPQEYIGVSHVAMLPNNKTVAVHDNFGGKVLHFSLDGRFISATPAGFRFSNMEYLDKDNLVCATYGTGDSDPGLEEYGHRNDLVYFANQEYQIKSSTMSQRYDRKRMVITPNLRKFGEQVYVHRPYSDTIYRAMPNGLKTVYRIEMGKIGGVANPDPGITRESFDLLQEKKATFSGFFTEGDKYVSIAVATPPNNESVNYLYSKQSGKVYIPEVNYEKFDDYIYWFLELQPMTSIKDRFVVAAQAHHILRIVGPKGMNATTQRPELANLTENSNPVIILYSFKEGL